MAAFIRCPSCAFCIGKYSDFFDRARQALYQEKVFGKDSTVVNYDPEKLMLNPGTVPPLEPIFDALGIKNMCCRMRLTGKTDFDRTYK